MFPYHRACPGGFRAVFLFTVRPAQGGFLLTVSKPMNCIIAVSHRPTVHLTCRPCGSGTSHKKIWRHEQDFNPCALSKRLSHQNKLLCFIERLFTYCTLCGATELFKLFKNIEIAASKVRKSDICMSTKLFAVFELTVSIHLKWPPEAFLFKNFCTITVDKLVTHPEGNRNLSFPSNCHFLY